MVELIDIDPNRGCMGCRRRPEQIPFPDELLSQLEQDAADDRAFASGAMGFVLAHYRRVCKELAEMKASSPSE